MSKKVRKGIWYNGYFEFEHSENCNCNNKECNNTDMIACLDCRKIFCKKHFDKFHTKRKKFHKKIQNISNRMDDSTNLINDSNLDIMKKYSELLVENKDYLDINNDINDVKPNNIENKRMKTNKNSTNTNNEVKIPPKIQKLFNDISEKLENLDLTENNIQKGNRLVEVGCGKGKFLDIVKSDGFFKYEGYDNAYEGNDKQIFNR